MRKQNIINEDTEFVMPENLLTIEEENNVFEMPEEPWTIMSALEYVYNVFNDRGLEESSWATCTEPLNFLKGELHLTDMQIVFLSVMLEKDEPMDFVEFASCLSCNRLTVMKNANELKDMEAMGWICKKTDRSFCRQKNGYVLEEGVESALIQNKAYQPLKNDGLDIQEFVNRLEHRLSSMNSETSSNIEDEEEWLMQLCKANTHLPLCEKVLQFDDIHTISLLLLVISQYGYSVDDDNEGVSIGRIDRIYPSECRTNSLRRKLTDATHPLIQQGWIEEDGKDYMDDSIQFVLTNKSKKELLAGYMPIRRKSSAQLKGNEWLKRHKDINEKQMFYNADEQQQIDELVNLLSQDKFNAVQRRMEKDGMRKGFNCLFYGGPGTGKTETVLQIARRTGRDLMSVNIADIRDKYVGESEKNIKNVFQRYRELCNQCEVMPILFLNEADALINKRSENTEKSVDKMENALQNIILQEMEHLEGILIATTNLTSNLDNAFERRFLYKIEFKNPDEKVRTNLWRNMVEGLKKKDASYLAEHYNFSGGQIENIARKVLIDNVLTGKSLTREKIEKYCSTESLHQKQIRPQIGFRA